MNWRGKYNLHPLHIEDCRNRNQAAKVEPMNDYLFIVLKPIDMDEEYTLQISGSGFLHRRGLDHHGAGRQCQTATDALNKVKRTPKLRPDEMFYRVMDTIVDSYQPIIDRVSDRIDEMEDLARSRIRIRRCWRNL